jgi:predicted GH43/DUF377 family glycosyl hydrolase
MILKHGSFGVSLVFLVLALWMVLLPCGFAAEGDKAADLQPLYQLAGDKVFKPYPGNPVLKPEVGQMDAAALGTMTVVRVNGVFHMYYEAWGAGDRRKSPATYYLSLQIGHATSTDGIHWTKDPANPVIHDGKAGEFDVSGTWDPFVLYEDGKFKMWYGGGVGDPKMGTEPMCPWGYAESTDGYHFVKKGQILSEAKIPNVEDDRVVHDQNSGHYFMYYLDQIHLCIMRAESPDETHFDYVHAIKIPMTGLHPGIFFKYPQVFQVDKKWYMLYGQPGGGSRDDYTGTATSPDGVNWTAINPDILPQAHDSALLKVADDLYVIYYGPNKQQDENNCDIRLAVFKGTFQDLIAPPK